MSLIDEQQVEDTELISPLVPDPEALAAVLALTHKAELEDLPPEDWREQSSCSQIDPELFYPDKENHLSPKTAKKVCAGCPVLDQCLDWALETREKHGIWGGLTETERNVLLKNRFPSEASSQLESLPTEADPMVPIIDTSSFLRLLSYD